MLAKLWRISGGIITAAMLVLALLFAFTPHSQIIQWGSSRTIVAQLLAFPQLLVLVSLGSLVWIVPRAIQNKRNTRRGDFVRVLAVLATAIAFAFSFFTSGSSTPQALNNHSPDTTFRLVSFNAEGALHPTDIAAIFIDDDADVAVFPEWGNSAGDDQMVHDMRELMRQAGVDAQRYDMFQSTPNGASVGAISPTTVVVKRSFGVFEQQPVDQVTFGTVLLTPHHDNAGLPPIIGLHTAPPLPFPSWMQRWRNDLDVVAHLPQEAIMAGDFNATLRHRGLGALPGRSDAVAEVHPQQRGTWNAGRPWWLRTPIDHVFVPTANAAIVHTAVAPQGASDHCKVVVDIALYERSLIKQ